MKRGDCRRATTAATSSSRAPRSRSGPHGPAAGPLSRMAYEARGMPAVHPRPLVRLSWTNTIGPLRVLPTSTKEHLMADTLYSGFVPVCVQSLTGLKTVLKKAEDHATTQKWDTAVVLNLRFYPDMFPLERQVRQVCNHALGAARVAGVGLPSLPDQDNSFAEIRSRIDKVIDCLKGLRPDQIDGKDDAKVTVTIGGQPQELSGQNYLYHFAILQVQFHATTAYDILRSTGVNIGKRDYLGPRPT